MLKSLFLNDRFILLLIILNSLVLFLGGFIQSGDSSYFLYSIDNIITVLFTLEMGVKLKVYGTKSYLESNWNRLDLTLVFLSLPALATFFLRVDSLDMSFLMIFRILRIFKTFRFIRFIPNIQHLISGIKRALSASVFILIGFAIYIFIIGILSFYLFRDNPSEYFNNPGKALYSIFKIFTIEGWFEIPEEITKDYSPVKTVSTYIFFVFVVLTGGIFGLSLVNSILVDTMVSDNNVELEAKVDALHAKIDRLIEDKGANLEK